MWLNTFLTVLRVCRVKSALVQLKSFRVQQQSQAVGFVGNPNADQRVFCLEQAAEGVECILRGTRVTRLTGRQQLDSGQLNLTGRRDQALA